MQEAIHRASLISWAIEKLRQGNKNKDEKLKTSPIKEVQDIQPAEPDLQIDKSIKRLKHIAPFKQLSFIKKEIKNMEDRTHSIKKIQNYKSIIQILTKSRADRTSFDIKLLTQLMFEKYEFFQTLLQEQKDQLKLEAIMNVIQLRTYEKGDKIVNFGEDENKFFLILKGQIGTYQHSFIQSEMTLRDFIIYLSVIKFEEGNEIKLRRIEETNAKLANFSNIRLFNYDYSKMIDTHIKSIFFIEEDKLSSCLNEGESFGNIISLETETDEIRKCQSTMLSLSSNCQLGLVEFFDYFRSLKDLHDKKFHEMIEELKKNFPILKKWPKNLIVKLMANCERVTLGYGDVLYEQGQNSENVYFILNGHYEYVTNISLGVYNDFIKYVYSHKGSFLHYLSKHGTFIEAELDDIKELLWNINEEFHLNFHQENDNYYKKILVPKKEQLVDIKLKEERLKHEKNVFPVKIRYIDTKDIIGFEEALEMKRRFYTVKCFSVTGELFKININVI
jgi:CRP-like cAMP-binding protein